MKAIGDEKIEPCQLVDELYHCRLKRHRCFISFARVFQDLKLTTSSGCTGLMKYAKSDITGQVGRNYLRSSYPLT